MVGIYCITNKINGKKYIGQSKKILDRWKSHITHANPNSDTQIGRDLWSFGIQNFTFEVLELCSEFELNEKEQKYIEKYNTFSNGYNDSRGGPGVQKITDIVLKKIMKDLVNSVKTMKQIAIENNIGYHLVSKINDGRRYYDPLKKYPLRPKIMSSVNGNNGKAVVKYDLNNNFIQKFDNMKIAVSSVASTENTHYIIDCCKGRRSSAYGYIWKYYDETVNEGDNND